MSLYLLSGQRGRVGGAVGRTSRRTSAVADQPKAVGGSRLRLETMSIHDRSGTTARRALWFGGLLILLAGIVGMHGLSAHSGGMAPDVHAVAVHESAGASMSAAPVSTLYLAMTTAVDDLAGSALATGGAVVQGVHAGGMGLMATCVAVLALSLTALVRRLGSARGLALHRLASAPPPALGLQGRAPDPPSLTALSTRRC